MVKKTIMVSKSTVELFECNNIDVEEAVKNFTEALQSHKPVVFALPSADNLLRL